MIKELQREQEHTDTLQKRGEREEEFKAVVENAPDVIALFDRDLRRSYVNPKVQEHTGQTAAFLTGKSLENSGYPESFTLPFAETLQRVFASGCEETVELNYETPNGLTWFQIRCAPIRSEEGSVERVMTFSREITDRKRVEEAAQQSLAQFRTVVETMEEGLILANGEGHILMVNPAMLRLVGLKETPMENVRDYAARIQVTDSEGNPVPPEMLPINRALRGEIVRDVEHRILRRDTGRNYVALYSGTPVLDAEGRVIMAVVTVRDITERKQMEEELRRGRDELEIRVQKRTAELKAYAARLELLNQELEDFAFIASHDLQEPLRKIQVFSDLFLRRYGSFLDDQGRDYLERLSSSADRMRELILAIRSYSMLAGSTTPFTMVDLKGMIEEEIQALKDLVEKTGAVIRIGDFPPLPVNGNLIRILFQNLLSNALKYRKEDQPEIEITCMEVGENLQITVEDNGIGFDERYAELIFKPFKRLNVRNECEGTGMGLALCRKIIDRHGGTIAARGIPGKGSTFTVTLPLGRKARLLQKPARRTPSVQPMGKDASLEDDAQPILPRGATRRPNSSCSEGSVTIKRNGIILEASAEAADMLGVEKSYFFTEWPLKRFIAPQDRDRFHAYLQSLLQEKTRQDCDLTLMRANGQRFHALLISLPERDPCGEVKTIKISISDIYSLKEQIIKSMAPKQTQ
jgi:PAS domain S-box-containing protein